MGYCKDRWIEEHERIGEEYAIGEIERDEAHDRLRRLGLNEREIAEHLDAVEEDRASLETLAPILSAITKSA